MANSTAAIISNYLDTYQGRDKILRTLSYMAKLATGMTRSDDAATRFKKFGSELSGCRVMLRLLDDIPNLHSAITYGLGAQEPDWLIRCAELLQITVHLFYGPIEHICWAGDRKIVAIDTKAWDSATIWCWIVSISLSLFKSIRRLQQLKNNKTCLDKSNCESRIALKTISSQRNSEILTSIRLILDVSYAVSYLPPGILWGGRLTTWQVGALGTVSSLIGLYQSIHKEVAHQKHK
ncbi:peroxisomal membrane protein 11C [Orussus abietinus]|uniref:peroxisomal membrane protein 11C n=1 Tax=Orussus abietinus TaxID=222816 RepID=UPI000626DA9C|nr:peroxisomal membrane protein 11C [Orussus abietinus]